MSAEENARNTHDLRWIAFMGDFSLLKDFLSGKRHSFLGMLLGGFDALLRGFGQVVFANNPVSGMLIIITFALNVPGALVAAAITGFLGLLLSLMLRDSRENIVNGLTVYNPVLIGSVTYEMREKFGGIDGFAILMILVGTILSVYLTRALATGRFPCITVPFNVVEIIILLVLIMRKTDLPDASMMATEQYVELEEEVNGTMATNIISESLDAEKLNWGSVFRGVVVSASQVYAVDNIIVGSVIYLGIIVYSPITALFSFLGALTGCLVALGLGVSYDFIYAGLWGYNSFLTGAAFGGLFLVLSAQTGAAAFVAIIFTTLFQYVAEPLMAKIGLPILTIPFVVTAWLFFGLRDSIDDIFPRPGNVTFPEHEYHTFRSRRRDLELYTVDEGSDPEIATRDQKISSND